MRSYSPPMSAFRSLVLVVALLLPAGAARAQSQPARADSPAAAPGAVAPTTKRPGPQPLARQLTVNVEVPKAVSFLSDCAKIVFSREDDGNTVGRLMQRFRSRKEKQVVSLRVDLPANKVTKTLGIVE